MSLGSDMLLDDADFLRELALRVADHIGPTQGFDQGDIDRLSSIARSTSAAGRLEKDMRCYIFDRTFERRAQCLDAYAQRAGLAPWKERQA